MIQDEQNGHGTLRSAVLDEGGVMSKVVLPDITVRAVVTMWLNDCT